MKAIILNRYQFNRMSQRGIRKSDIRVVVESPGGHIEVPGKVTGSRQRWKEVRGRKIAVVFIETNNAYHIITVYPKGEEDAHRHRPDK